VGEVQQAGNVVVLSIVRTIKGELSPGASVRMSTSTSGCEGRAIVGQYGLWFLSKAGNEWAPLPVENGNVHSPCWIGLSKKAIPDTMHTLATPSTHGDHIAKEIVASLLADGSRFHPQIVGEHLRGIQDSTVLPELYSNLRGSADPDLRFLGLLGLLSGPQAGSALAEIADNLDLALKSRAGVCAAIWGIRNPNPTVVRSLGKIAANTQMQGCAAAALNWIHTLDTLPFLALLLDSSDLQTRTWAVWGFSKFVNNIPIVPPNPNIPGTGIGPQGPTPYRTRDTDKHSPGAHPATTVDDGGDVQFWKAWWAEMKDKLP